MSLSMSGKNSIGSGPRERRACQLLALITCGIVLLLPASLAGEADSRIRIVGSDTMLVLNTAWAEAFEREDRSLDIEVEGGGSGKGIAALLAGEADIAAASRAMTPDERQRFQNRRGAKLLEVIVGVDGLAVYAHHSNSIRALSIEQVAGIFSGRIRNWKEVGGRDRPIRLYIRNEDSGTHVFFREKILGTGLYSDEALRVETTPAILEAVSRDQSGVGHGGIAYARGAHIIKIHSGDPTKAVYPSNLKVRSGEYPLTRALRFYFSSEHREELVKRFAEWVLTEPGQAIVEDVGYFGVTGVYALPFAIEE